jgi:hypothetical protein
MMMWLFKDFEGGRINIFPTGSLVVVVVVVGKGKKIFIFLKARLYFSRRGDIRSRRDLRVSHTIVFPLPFLFSRKKSTRIFIFYFQYGQFNIPRLSNHAACRLTSCHYYLLKNH